MKKLIRSALAILCCAAAMQACVEVTELSAPEMTADVAAFTDVPAHNPGVLSVTLTTKVNWIVQTPSWVTPSSTYGSGNSIVSFTVNENYKDEKTTTLERSGEIVFSGGGTLTGNGAKLIIPIQQEGYTYVDPSGSIGGIPDTDEFVAFCDAFTAGLSTKRWTNEAGEIELLADINLATVQNWQKYADLYSTANANNDCTLGEDAHPFTGVFNGKNHKITGFNPTVELAANGTFGLFPATMGATIKDLKLEGTATITAKGQADAGILVGTALNSTISNVTVSGKMVSTGTSASARFALGGLIGFACATGENNVLVENCTGNVAAEAVGGDNTANGATCAMYGGICGFSTYNKGTGRVSIKNCTNNGNMTVTLGRCSGIVATPNGGTVFDGCTNNGKQVNSIANGRLGNIACVVGSDSKFVNCVNNADLETIADGYAGTAAGLIALLNADNVTVEGGANKGTIRTTMEASNSNSKYIGLLVANFSKFASVKDVKVGGDLVLAGVSKGVNETNFMNFIGSVSDANKAKITGLVWDGSAPTPPAAEGIATAADLKEFAALVNAGGDYSKFVVDGAVVLGADIDLGGEEWVPAGNGTVTDKGVITGASFTGVFDARNHTVDNFKVTVGADAETYTVAGLFGILNGATVKNLTIGSKVVIYGESKTQSYLGGVAGYLVDATVDKCRNYASISLKGVADDKRECVGGIAGQMYVTASGTPCVISHCENYGVLTSVNTANTKNGGTGISLAGIAGFSDSAADGYYCLVQFCNNKVEISAEATRLSGIVASTNSRTKVEDCVNEKKISDTDVKASNSRVAGIVSAASTGVEITRCINKGDIVFPVAGDKDHGYAAGIIGQTNNPVVIDACESYGSILSDMFMNPTTQMGIILANANGKAATIKNCKVGGKIGPFVEDDTNKVVTITEANFDTYITLNTAKANALKKENNTFGSL